MKLACATTALLMFIASCEAVPSPTAPDATHHDDASVALLDHVAITRAMTNFSAQLRTPWSPPSAAGDPICPTCSAACNTDFGKLYGNNGWVLAFLGAEYAGVGLAFAAGISCIAPGVVKGCNTHIGHGVCCSANSDWSSDTDSIVALQTAGAALTPGKIQWIEIVEATKVPDGKGGQIPFQVTWTRKGPDYFPQSCLNSGDLAAFSKLCAGPQPPGVYIECDIST